MGRFRKLNGLPHLRSRYCTLQNNNHGHLYQVQLLVLQQPTRADTILFVCSMLCSSVQKGFVTLMLVSLSSPRGIHCFRHFQHRLEHEALLNFFQKMLMVSLRTLNLPLKRLKDFYFSQKSRTLPASTVIKVFGSKNIF